MKLQRTARRHQAATDPVLFWEFMPGDRVMVVEGFLGTVVSVEDGFGAGTEQYQVELDAGMGGGEYSAGELSAVEGTTAKVANETNPSAYTTEDQVPAAPPGDDMTADMPEMDQMDQAQPGMGANPYTDQNPYMAVASDDYPMLSEILTERPPLPHSERVGAYDPATGQFSGDLDEGFAPCPRCGTDSLSVTQWGSAIQCGNCGWSEGTLASKTAAKECPKSGQRSTRHPGIDQCEYCGRDVRTKQDGTYSKHNLPSGVQDDSGDEPSPSLIPPELQRQRLLEEYAEWDKKKKSSSVPVRIRRAAGYVVEDIDGQVVAGPFVSRLDAEAAERAAREEGQSNLVITRLGMSQGETKPSPDPWWLDKFLLPLAEEINKGHPEEWRYDPATGRGASYDWCRFRRNRRCFYPKQLNEAATQEAGYAVWVPEDRGFCPRDPWEGEMGQMNCPVSEPGPHAKPPHRPLADATIPWEHGGQRYDANGNPKAASLEEKTAAHTYERVRYLPGEDAKAKTVILRNPQVIPFMGHEALTGVEVGMDGQEVAPRGVDERKHLIMLDMVKARTPMVMNNTYGELEVEGSKVSVFQPDPELAFHITATWRDVQAKAKRIHQDGHVRVISSTPAYLVGEVRGDTDIYQTTLAREGSSKRIAMWECGCAWASYSWGRSGRWKKYEGRMCSHALALNYEGQSRGWGGQEVTEDTSLPQWRSDPSITVKVPGDYKKPEITNWRLNSKTAASDTLPPEPGKSPIPGGTHRMFHVTGIQNLDSVKRNGLTLSTARGSSYGEPDAIWFSNKTDYYEGGSSDAILVEVAIPQSALEGLGLSLVGSPNGNMAVPFDIPPAWIVEIHEPWHEAYRFLSDPQSRQRVKDGFYDNVLDNPQDRVRYEKAINLIKREGVKGIDTCKFCGSEDLFDSYFDEEGYAVSGLSPGVGYGPMTQPDGEWKTVCNNCGEFQEKVRRKKKALWEPPALEIARDLLADGLSLSQVFDSITVMGCLNAPTVLNYLTVPKVAGLDESLPDTLGKLGGKPGPEVLAAQIRDLDKQFDAVPQGQRTEQGRIYAKRMKVLQRLAETLGVSLSEATDYVSKEGSKKTAGMAEVKAWLHKAKKWADDNGYYLPGEPWKDYLTKVDEAMGGKWGWGVVQVVLGAAAGLITQLPGGMEMVNEVGPYLLQTLGGFEGLDEKMAGIAEDLGWTEERISRTKKRYTKLLQDQEAEIRSDVAFLWVWRWNGFKGALVPTFKEAAEAAEAFAAGDENVLHSKDLYYEGANKDWGPSKLGTIKEGDRVTTRGGMEGTVLKVVDKGMGGIPVATVEWESGSTGRHTVTTLKKISAEEILKDEPEPALPSTTGEEEEDEIVPGDPRLAWIMKDVPTQPTGGKDEMNVADAARTYLAKTGVKNFTAEERRVLIEEGEMEGVVASNLDRLDIAGTHYEPLEEAYQIQDEEWWA